MNEAWVEWSPHVVRQYAVVSKREHFWLLKLREDKTIVASVHHIESEEPKRGYISGDAFICVACGMVLDVGKKVYRSQNAFCRNHNKLFHSDQTLHAADTSQ
jgi:hypothetical protein